MAERIEFGFEGTGGANSGPQGQSGSLSGSNGASAGGAGTETGVRSASTIPPAVKRRRGRPAYPRDAQGNVIRPDEGNASQAGTQTREGSKASSREKLAVGKGAFTPNNRKAIQQQIQGMHEALATLTRQPVFMLSPPEAEALTGSLCNVLDYHEFNLTEAGGAGGLYLALGLTLFVVYKPKLDFIKSGGMRNVTPSPATPATPGDASQGRPMMDFTADLDPPPPEASIM